MFQKTSEFKAVQVKLASPEQILGWSYGEVTKPETINYRTQRPEKEGLFDEKIFGPVKDWECYCGKYKRIRYKGIICDKCGVEVTRAQVRRERMGHIKLAVPVAHIWFLRGVPSRLGLILNLSVQELEKVIYFASYVITEVKEDARAETLAQIEKEFKAKKKEIETRYEKLFSKSRSVKASSGPAEEEHKASIETELARLQDNMQNELSQLEKIRDLARSELRSLKKMQVISELEYRDLSLKYGPVFKAGIGAEAVFQLVKAVDLEKLITELEQELVQSEGANRRKNIKRLKLAKNLTKSGMRPESMLITILPVIPPDLRPMVQLDGGRFAASDLNDLYRRVINRNNRLKRLLEINAPEVITRNEKRMLQEAVDALIDNSMRHGKEVTASTGQRRKLRSLADMLRGKQGRFRQNLLGKRVDYSGRSVIVVGPHLKLNQCGLPKEMALEMFKPFVLRELITRGLAPNVRSAKYVLERRTPEVFDILEEITRNHPVALNRAPTLHKLGIQAFYPILIEGSAIQVHPLVCDGFNADFDGDQMAVHVPLSQNSRAEAANLMLAEHNLLKPADGMPVTAPRKEIILGIYIYTSIDEKIPQANTIFSDFSEATLAWQEHKIALRQKIKVRHDKTIMETTVGRVLVNEFLPKELGFINETLTAKKVRALVSQAMDMISSDEVVKLLDNLKQTGFAAATSPGISLGIFDLPIPSDMGGTIAEGDAEIAEVDSNYQAGLITAGERDKLQIEIWLKITDKISDLTWDMYSKDNPARLIVEAGAGRVNRDTMKQISGMRGLMNDPTGKIVPMPIKSNFRQGFNVFEYIIGTRGSRKGLADTALRTADAGYLTRRLVDVSHDAIIRLVDCATTEGIEISADDKRGAYTSRLLGRILAAEVKSGKRVLGSAGEEIDERLLAEIEKEKITSVFVRSPLRCQAKYGLCQKCYGRDFSTRKFVELGTPVGIIAAQSIGAPGTQLTLRPKPSGGVVAPAVTQGLPRVEELFETRSPKVLSPIAEIAGKVEITETPEGYKLRIRSVGVKPVEEREYIIPLTAQLKVADGDLVTAGVQLSSGAL